jgi:Tol biopolymer transport system component
MEADGSNPTNITDDPGAEDEAPACSPDGTRIAFLRTIRREDGIIQNRGILVMDVRLAEG